MRTLLISVVALARSPRVAGAGWLLALLLAWSPLARAGDPPKPLVEVILEAELLIVAEIRQIEKDTLTVSVLQSMGGALPSVKRPLIKVHVDRDAPRPVPYAINQRFVWMLRYRKGVPVPVGKRGEGELPIIDGVAYTVSETGGPAVKLPGAPAHRARPLPLDELVKASGTLPRQVVRRDGRLVIRDKDALARWAGTTSVHAILARQLRARRE